jgi:hypothetical protein
MGNKNTSFMLPLPNSEAAKETEESRQKADKK